MKIKAWKGFEKSSINGETVGLGFNNFEYRENQSYSIDGKPILKQNGFHAYKQKEDVLRFSYAVDLFASVEMEVDKEPEDGEYVSNSITIGKFLSLNEFCENNQDLIKLAITCVPKRAGYIHGLSQEMKELTAKLSKEINEQAKLRIHDLITTFTSYFSYPTQDEIWNRLFNSGDLIKYAYECVFSGIVHLKFEQKIHSTVRSIVMNPLNLQGKELKDFNIAIGKYFNKAIKYTKINAIDNIMGNK